MIDGGASAPHMGGIMEASIKPFVRCRECQKMSSVESIKAMRGCTCGSKTFRPLSYINEAERDVIAAQCPEYLDEFKSEGNDET